MSSAPLRLPDDFVARYADKTPDWGFAGLGYVTYKRTYARPIFDDDGTLIRSEEWHETVRRVVEGANAIGADLDAAEMERLFDYVWRLKGSPGGRMLWQMGTSNNDRIGGDSLVNCWFVTLESPADFEWMFDRLMLGGGVGFSVEAAHRLGRMKSAKVEHLEGAADADYIVPDKREGWSHLVRKVIEAHQTGRGFTYSTVLVRPEGAPIRGFGGTASGPGILIEGVGRIHRILEAAAGRSLTSVEVLDIANLIGSIVVSGNVRRSAQIAIGSADDEAYMAAKRWDLGGVPSWRAMSNNSVEVEDFADLPEDFWTGYHGNGEPYGLVNLKAARTFRRTWDRSGFDPTIEGFNPCAEIPLAHRESCNLAEVFLPRIDSLEEFKDVARLLYKVQKAVAAMPYLDEESDAITSQNLRLGLGVTGVAMAGEERLGWLHPAYEALREFDKEWSAAKGLPPSVRLTTVKPSGTLSLLAGVTPGVHPGWSPFYVRRVRMAATDPLVTWCAERGFPVEPEVTYDQDEDGNPILSHNPRTMVVEFPVALPEGAATADQTSALDLLRTQARLQNDWADNAVSVTVTFRPEELDGIKAYLASYWETIKSVSFLPYEEHGFAQAPYEAITREEYDRRVALIRSDLPFVVGGLSEVDDADCVSGACPIR